MSIVKGTNEMCNLQLMLLLATLVGTSLVEVQCLDLGTESHEWIRVPGIQEFFVSNETASWGNAREICKNKSADLAEFPHMSATEIKNYLDKIMPSLSTKAPWLGGNPNSSHIMITGPSKWLSNKPIQGDAWFQYHSNHNIHQCLHFWISGLNDIKCDRRQHFICERFKDYTNPRIAPTENSVDNKDSNHNTYATLSIFSFIANICFLLVTIALIMYIRKNKQVKETKYSVKGNQPDHSPFDNARSANDIEVDDEMQYEEPIRPAKVSEPQRAGHEGRHSNRPQSDIEMHYEEVPPRSGPETKPPDDGQDGLYEEIQGGIYAN